MWGVRRKRDVGIGIGSQHYFEMGVLYKANLKESEEKRKMERVRKHQKM